MGNNFTPAWIKKGFFNESLFCDDFLSTHQLLYVNGAFFTPEGRVTDTMNLRCEIFDMLRDHIGANIAKRVSNVVDVLKLAAQVEDFPPVTDRIALANGTLYLDGTFQEGKPEIVRNRLPVKYDPKAAQPVPVRPALPGGYPHGAGIHRLLPDPQQQGAAHDGHQGQRR